MRITVFQALTLLANKYQANDEKMALIKPIYIRGLTSNEDNIQLTTLLEDPSLSLYEFVDDIKSVTEDPVRRYFESTLMLETLNDTLDALDEDLLNEHFQCHFNRMPTKDQTDMAETVFINKELSRVAGRNLGEEEYASSISILKQKDGFLIFKPQNMESAQADLIFKVRKKKLLLITKIAFCAVVNVQENNAAYPVNIYVQPDSIFSSKHRGRELKGNPSEPFFKQSVRSHNLGIMRSYMPLARDSPLLANQPASYLRPTDFCRYIEGKYWPNTIQKKKVLTFVNSISGTLFMELRFSKQLLNENSYCYTHSPIQLKLFYKAYIAFLLYSSGGHSIEEFVSVFKLPEIREAFKDLSGFETLNSEQLFLEDRNFNNAVRKTIEYNQTILNKMQVHEEIVQP